jgi:hypothetical protein
LLKHLGVLGLAVVRRSNRLLVSRQIGQLGLKRVVVQQIVIIGISLGI